MDKDNGALIVTVMSAFVLVGFLIFFFFPQLFSMVIEKELPCKYPLLQEYEGICDDSDTGIHVTDPLDCGCAKMRAAVFFIDICLLVSTILAATIIFLGPKIMKRIKNR